MRNIFEPAWLIIQFFLWLFIVVISFQFLLTKFRKSSCENNKEIYEI